MTNQWLNSQYCKIKIASELIESESHEINCYNFLIKNEYFFNKSKRGRIDQSEVNRIMRELCIDDSD